MQSNSLKFFIISIISFLCLNANIPADKINPQAALVSVNDYKFIPVYEKPQTINGKTYFVHSAFKEHSVKKSENGGIYRFEVRKGECRSSESGKERSELSGGNYKYPIGTDIWVSYSFMVETGEALPGTANILGQFHAGTGSPSFSFRLPYDNKLQIVLRYGDSADYTQSVPFEMNDFARGKWYNVVIHARFSPKPDAVLQVWIDGHKAVDKSNIVMGYNDSNENYWKFGIYRSTNISQTEVVYFANMELETVSLFDRIANPKPVVLWKRFMNELYNRHEIAL